MPLETGGLVALVAGSSVLAAVVTQGASWIRDWVKQIKDGSYAALYLAIALESYASECASCIGESENYDSSGGHAGNIHGNIPDLPAYPDSVEWKPLGIARTAEAMSFRVEIETIKAMITDHWDYLDEDDVVPMVREEAARLGSKALELAIDFRNAWKIAAVDYNDEWNVRSFLVGRIERYQELKLARQKQQQKFIEELSHTATDEPAKS